MKQIIFSHFNHFPCISMVFIIFFISMAALVLCNLAMIVFIYDTYTTHLLLATGNIRYQPLWESYKWNQRLICAAHLDNSVPVYLFHILYSGPTKVLYRYTTSLQVQLSANLQYMQSCNARMWDLTPLLYMFDYTQNGAYKELLLYELCIMYIWC